MFSPARGTLAIRRDRARPHCPANTELAACDDAPREAIGAFYMPAPGWHGADSVALSIEAPSGKQWTADFVVTTD